MVDFKHDDLVGSYFEFGGRGPKYDCWGLVRECLLRQGLNVSDYPSNFSDRKNASTVANVEGEWSKLLQPDIGCVVLFNGTHGLPSHVGVIVSKDRFLHISAQCGRAVIERLSYPLWKGSIVGFYRWKQ